MAVIIYLVITLSELKICHKLSTNLERDGNLKFYFSSSESFIVTFRNGISSLTDVECILLIYLFFFFLIADFMYSFLYHYLSNEKLNNNVSIDCYLFRNQFEKLYTCY